MSGKQLYDPAGPSSPLSAFRAVVDRLASLHEDVDRDRDDFNVALWFMGATGGDPMEGLDNGVGKVRARRDGSLRITWYGMLDDDTKKGDGQ